MSQTQRNTDNLVSLYPATYQALTPLAGYYSRSAAVAIRHMGQQIERNTRAVASMLGTTEQNRLLRISRDWTLETSRGMSTLAHDLQDIAQSTFDEIVDRTQREVESRPAE